MSKTARRVVAGDGTGGSLTPEQIVALGVKHGVIRNENRAAMLAKAQANPSAVLSVVCAGLRPAGAVTPATTATAVSGPAVAVPTAYPASWTRRAAAAVGRIASDRAGKRSAVRAQGPIHDVTATPALIAAARIEAQAQVASAQASRAGYDDRRVQPSPFAAAQEDRRQAEVAAMRAEQKARGI